MRWALVALAFPMAVSAQPFIELGVGVATGGCLFDDNTQPVVFSIRASTSTTSNCSRNPLGLFAVGYQFSDRWRIQWDHWSSLPDSDRGVEILAIRYRYTFK